MSPVPRWLLTDSALSMQVALSNLGSESMFGNAGIGRVCEKNYALSHIVKLWLKGLTKISTNMLDGAIAMGMFLV